MVIMVVEMAMMDLGLALTAQPDNEEPLTRLRQSKLQGVEDLVCDAVHGASGGVFDVPEEGQDQVEVRHVFRRCQRRHVLQHENLWERCLDIHQAIQENLAILALEPFVLALEGERLARRAR